MQLQRPRAILLQSSGYGALLCVHAPRAILLQSPLTAASELAPSALAPVPPAHCGPPGSGPGYAAAHMHTEYTYFYRGLFGREKPRASPYPSR